MGDKLITEIATIASGLIGLAIIAVILSRNANTVGVIGVSTQGFANDIAAATSPVSATGMAGGMINPLAYGSFNNAY